MSKRNANGSLTGGTGDVNPQWFNMGAGAASNAATWAEASQAIPNDPGVGSTTRKLVMEILKVQFIVTGTTTLSIAADGAVRFYLSTQSWTAEPTLIQQTGRVVCKKSVHTSDDRAGAGTSVAFTNLETIEDITDGAGHGVLVAVDTMYVGVVGTASSGLSGGNVSARMLYRWKYVPIMEWVGMVQSQSS